MLFDIGSEVKVVSPNADGSVPEVYLNKVGYVLNYEPYEEGSEFCWYEIAFPYSPDIEGLGEGRESYHFWEEELGLEDGSYSGSSPGPA